eukprot:TRINITY_DN5031_c0_g1_i3.p2 TRINITY_DN5031_c0_g1~~TRINITY_DN5031_c0_g1_i3.p2  ORF type:complete len:282 (-),score=52.24 TRINITY_DN5031_c0_g1_i3:83-928(-)
MAAVKAPMARLPNTNVVAVVVLVGGCCDCFCVCCCCLGCGGGGGGGRSGGGYCSGSSAVNGVVEVQSPKKPSSVSKKPVCIQCNRRFSALWLCRGICCECEELFRSEGKCPFSKGCQPLWFCEHESRCLKCDEHSCQRCRFSRGDGEHVRDLAARLRPSFIALDFDRTLATSRSGGEPIIGKDSADSELLALLWEHEKACAVVTRNSHVKEIKKFLAHHGAPEDLPIHSLRRPRSKAEHIVPGLKDGDSAIFVDDSIAELMDPLVSVDSRVHRVLFVRAIC